MGYVTHRLRYDRNTRSVGECASLIFGHLVTLAGPVLGAYKCDLYYDALWLKDVLKGKEFTFYYSFNESGTSIGHTDEVLTRTHRYRLTVTLDDGRTSLEVVDMSVQVCPVTKEAGCADRNCELHYMDAPLKLAEAPSFPEPVRVIDPNTGRPIGLWR